MGIYGGLSNSHKERITKIQRKVIKSILRLPARYPSSELFSLLNVFSFEQLYKLDLIRLGRDFILKADRPAASYELRGRGEGTVKCPNFRLDISRCSLE